MDVTWYAFDVPIAWMSKFAGNDKFALTAVYAIYLLVKMTVIFGAHSSIRWDEPLYKIKWLSPVMWLVERTISTPATHFAHHGMHKDDGVTHYKGNYGNLLFLWDVLFGTAHITRLYPKEYGIENLGDRSAGGELASSALDGPLERTAQQALVVHLIDVGQLPRGCPQAVRQAGERV